MKRLSLIAIAIALLPVAAAAQELEQNILPPIVIVADSAQPGTVEVIPSGASFSVAWDLPIPDDLTLGYRWWCGTLTSTPTQRAIVKNFLPADVTRTAASATVPAHGRVTIVGMKDGTYACHVTAFKDLAGTILESDPSNSILIAIGNKPAAPTNLRRIQQQIANAVQDLRQLNRALADEITALETAGVIAKTIR